MATWKVHHSFYIGPREEQSKVIFEVVIGEGLLWTAFPAVIGLKEMFCALHLRCWEIGAMVWIDRSLQSRQGGWYIHAVAVTNCIDDSFHSKQEFGQDSIDSGWNLLYDVFMHKTEATIRLLKGKVQ